MKTRDTTIGIVGEAALMLFALYALWLAMSLLPAAQP